MASKEPLEALRDTTREISSLIWGPQVPQARRDLYARVLILVRDHWKPQRKDWNENRYRDELVDFLYSIKKTPSIHISTKEFADVVILEGDHPVVALELKLDLRGKGEIRVLKGQLEEDIPKCVGAIAVLLGKTSREDCDKVKQLAKKIEESTKKPVRVIQKRF